MAGVSPDSLLSGTLASYGASAVARVCVECLIGKQKKPILFKVTEPSSIPYRVTTVSAEVAGHGNVY